MVATLLCDLKISHLDARNSEVRNFKLHADGLLQSSVTLFGCHTRQTKVGSHHVLLLPSELLDLPNQAAILGSVLDLAHRCLEAWGIRIFWNRNADFDIVGIASSLEIRLRFDQKLHPRILVALNLSLNPNQWANLRRETIVHEVELSIRRNKGDGPVALEAAQSHTLMESNVVHLYTLPACTTSVLHEDLVVEPKLQLWHTAEVGLHLDGSHDFGVKHCPIGCDQQVQLLNHIQENLIFLVLDSFRSPRSCPSKHSRNTFCQLFLFNLVSFSRPNELFQSLGVGCLGVSEIHHLIQELVDDHEVVLDTFLFKLVEVLSHDFHHKVQEVENHHDIRVLVGDSHDVKRVMLDVAECVRSLLEDRLHVVLVVSEYSFCEALRYSHGHVSAVVAGQ
mmetsp:Transcript_6541/g.12955  ORF Transcript_6541/g.12955 Transcript_6541/m.12955 type:complete len:393 (-) Transcript_6541:127-1305(-)